MLGFLLRRMGQSVILLFLVSLIGFAALTLAPGGPLSQYALTPGMSQQALDRLAEQMGLNRPLPVQYWDWLTHLLRGDWGRSYRDGQPVLTVIFSHVPATSDGHLDHLGGQYWRLGRGEKRRETLQPV